MESLSGHVGVVVSLLGVIFAMLIALTGFTVNFIINSVRSELTNDRAARVETMKGFAEKIDKVESFLESISGEIFERLRKVESSTDSLWHEHKLIKEIGCGIRPNNPARNHISETV